MNVAEGLEVSFSVRLPYKIMASCRMQLCLRVRRDRKNGKGIRTARCVINVKGMIKGL